MSNRDEIPDGVPADFEEMSGGDQPGSTPIQIGMNPAKGMVLMKIGGQMVGLPVASALMLGHSITGKALHMLLNSDLGPPPEDDGPRIYVP